MAKKQQDNEVGYFLDLDLHDKFREWWRLWGKEEEDKRVTSFIQAFPDDLLIHESVGAATDGPFATILDHVRLLVEQEDERERVKSDLMYLSREYLGYKDLDEDLHGGGIRELEEAIAAGHRDILILWPRGHLKTSLFAIARTIQGVLKNQNCRKGIMSYAYSRAMEILAEIKAHLQNPRLVKLFPEILWENPKKDAPFWSENRITVIRSKVASGFSLKVNGIMGGWTGGHNDELIFDDPHDLENTETLDLIQKVIERFINADSVLDPDGLRIVDGTIWANEDLYAWCKEHGFYIIRRTATENSRGEECDVDDPDAHVVFPEKFSLEVLRKKKSANRVFYAKQYNLLAMSAEDIKFPEEMLDKLVYENDPEYKRIYILIDPALSKTRAADATAKVVIGQPKDNKLPFHVIKSESLRKKTQGVINAIFDEYQTQLQRCTDIFVGIEQAALQYILIEWLQKEIRERKIFFEPHELKHGNRPKPERISRLEPMFNSGGIVLHKSRCSGLRKQLLNYGATLEDNEIDALAYLPTVLDDTAPIEIITPEQYREKYDPYSMEAVLEQMESGGDSWRDF